MRAKKGRSIYIFSAKTGYLREISKLNQESQYRTQRKNEIDNDVYQWKV